MIQDARYFAKLGFRSRGHADLTRRVGGIFPDVDERLERGGVVQLLELGCGFGTALLELRERYGPKVALFGLNRRPRDGDAEAMLRNGTHRGLIVRDAPLKLPLPTISFGDIADGLPFDDDTFDLVYSQVAWRYFGNKIHVLREVSRILRETGLAKIDVEEFRAGLPPEYGRLVEILHEGRVVPFGEYLQRFGMGFTPSVEGEYLRFEKCADFGLDLELISQIDLSEINPVWDGVKCVYRVAR